MTHLSKMNSNNRYFLLTDAEFVPIEEREIYGMIKQTPKDATRYYTIDPSLIVSDSDLVVSLKEISEAEFENRELFEINKVLPLIHESRFSFFVRHNQYDLMYFATILSCFLGIGLCYFAQFETYNLSSILFILLTTFITIITGIKIMDCFISKVIKKFGTTRWINEPTNTDIS